MPKEVAARALFAEMGAKATACGEDDELDGGEIVLGVGVSEAVSGFGVSGAMHAGYAVGVARDGGVIGDVGGGGRGCAGRERECDEQRRDAFHVFPQARTV